jgi:hypothetical protein
MLETHDPHARTAFTIPINLNGLTRIPSAHWAIAKGRRLVSTPVDACPPQWTRNAPPWRESARNHGACCEHAAFAPTARPLHEASPVSHDEVEQQFGASADDLAKVEELAHKHGLGIKLASAAERRVIQKLAGELARLIAAAVGGICAGRQS